MCRYSNFNNNNNCKQFKCRLVAKTGLNESSSISRDLPELKTRQ